MSDSTLASTSAETESNEPTGRAIASLVLALLGLVGAMPCIGPILAIFLGAGEESGVGRAGFLLGWVGILVWCGLGLLGIVLAVLAGGIALLGSL